MPDLDDITQRLRKIEERNKRVEVDKAWEKSFFRISIIALVTYLVALIFLVLTELPSPYLNAFIPTIGWILSMKSTPILKKWWMKRRTP